MPHIYSYLEKGEAFRFWLGKDWSSGLCLTLVISLHTHAIDNAAHYSFRGWVLLKFELAAARAAALIPHSIGGTGPEWDRFIGRDWICLEYPDRFQGMGYLPQARHQVDHHNKYSLGYSG